MSKVLEYKNKIIELNSKGYSSRKIVKVLEDEYGVHFSKSTINYHLKEWTDGDSVTKQDDSTYSEGVLSTDAFKHYCEKEGIDISRVTSAKYVNHAGQQKFNIVLDYKEDESNTIDYKTIIDEAMNYKFTPDRDLKPSPKASITRLVYTDTHIAMCTDSEETAMYATPWNENTLMDTMELMCKYVISNKVGNTLIIDDLGDVLDGWDGYTTRGGHKLPQNMSSQKAFKVALQFKLSMLDILHPYFDNILCHNVCNDNHSGAFSMILNHAFMRVAHERYNNVFVVNYERFIDHYIFGRHAFVLTHGKDSKSLKFGFKPKLDSVQIEKIDHYLKHNERGSIYKEADFIWFDKGDSHQLLFDYSTAQDFNYMNHIALSPSSEWVQANFKKGDRGFTIQQIEPMDRNIKMIPIII